MKITFSKTYEISVSELEDFVKKAEPTTTDEDEQLELLGREIFAGELSDLKVDEFNIEISD